MRLAGLCLQVLSTQCARTHHVRFPQRLAHAVQLLGARAAHHEVVRHHRAADQIERRHVRFVRLWVQSGHHRLDEVRAESANQVLFSGRD